jgi:hypothetical protein
VQENFHAEIKRQMGSDLPWLGGFMIAWGEFVGDVMVEFMIG